MRSFGWSETETTIIFIYRSSRDSTSQVTFPCPRFVTAVEHRANGKRYKVRSYQWNSIYVDGLRILDYRPSDLYFPTKCITNVKLLSARLCLERNREGNIKNLANNSSFFIPLF